MKDATTKKPLSVAAEGSAGPYIMVSVAQLEDLKRLLESNRVRYWVEEDVISFDGEPEVAVVDLGQSGDAQAVQKLLDAAP